MLPLSEIFLTFLRLGLTSFGGPVAHLGYYHEALVRRRGWLSESAYADLVALCQFLPGPASSQVSMGFGLAKGGLAGAFVAWLGFTLPSAILMTVFGFGALSLGGEVAGETLHGLKIAAVAVVAHAVWSMGRGLCTDRGRLTLAFASAAVVSLWVSPVSQVAVILFGAAAGRWLLNPPAVGNGGDTVLIATLPRHTSTIALSLFTVLLLGLPLIASQGSVLGQIDSFYRAGSLVFGGGHVVLPLLQAEVVPTGAVDRELFLAGYGAAQAVPGPVFTFAAFLGTVSSVGASGVIGALVCLVAIFLPGALLLVGTLPHWDRLRGRPGMQAALSGVNAAVVGLLGAALYHPVWTAGITDRFAFALFLLDYVLLALWRWPAWAVVLLSAVIGAVAG